MTDFPASTRHLFSSTMWTERGGEESRKLLNEIVDGLKEGVGEDWIRDGKGKLMINFVKKTHKINDESYHVLYVKS